MAELNVTDQVRVGNPDDEICPVLRCVCGQKFEPWKQCLSVYRDNPTRMVCCGRRLYFCNEIQIFEVE
jgi:hypothetical protein